MIPKPGGKIEQLVKNGYIVAAVDPLGSGGNKKHCNTWPCPGLYSSSARKEHCWIQAADICRIGSLSGNPRRYWSIRIGALGINEMCLPLVHAAAFDKTIKNVILSGSLISYSSVVLNRFYRIGLTEREGGGTQHPYEVGFSWGIAGVLKRIWPAWPDCLVSLPGKCVLTDLKNQMLEPASDELIKEEMNFRYRYIIHREQVRPEDIVREPGFDVPLSAGVLSWSNKQN